MLPDTRNELKSLAKVTGAIGGAAALLGGAAWLALPPELVPAPGGQRVTFAFDPSPSPNVAGYRIHFGGDTNSLTNIVDVGNNTIVTLTNISHPLHAYVTAYDSNGNESLPSNLAGVLASETVASIFAQTNRDAGTAGWADAFPVKRLTNPPASQFYRLRIESSQNTVKYP